MSCPICGGSMVGDGHTTLRHCEFARDEDCEGKESEAGPVYCVALYGCAECIGSPSGVYPHDECSSCNKWPFQENAMESACKWRVYHKSFSDGFRYLWSDGKTTRWFDSRDDGSIWNSEDAQIISRAVHLLTGYEAGMERVGP